MRKVRCLGYCGKMFLSSDPTKHRICHKCRERQMEKTKSMGALVLRCSNVPAEYRTLIQSKGVQ